jgi:D-3-phosphoglycerate dehydrogenase
MPSIFSNKEFVSLKRDCSGLIELKNKTLGIIGFGAIGQEVARIALALQMNLRVYDYKARRFHLDISIGGSDYRFPSVKIPIITTDCLDSVLQASDIVTV